MKRTPAEHIMEARIFIILRGFYGCKKLLGYTFNRHWELRKKKLWNTSMGLVQVVSSMVLLEDLRMQPPRWGTHPPKGARPGLSLDVIRSKPRKTRVLLLFPFLKAASPISQLKVK